jgi:retron-type reverse transcriptase
MSKAKQIAVYLTEKKADQLKKHHKKITGSGKIVSLSSVVRDVLDEWLEELNELEEKCGCCDEGNKIETVSSELSAAFSGVQKKFKRPKKSKGITHTVPTDKSVGYKN